MSGYRQGKRSWMDEGFYPVNERLSHDAQNDDENAVFLVDMGGGLGHDLEELKQKYPRIRHLVLQDQPEVIGIPVRTQSRVAGLGEQNKC